jgi:molybdopterin molybdotransferase
MELLKVDTIAEARAKLLPLARPLFTRLEQVALGEAQGRVLAHDLVSADDVPGFTRSTVDGYAVIAADTAGAGESIPVVLTLVGSVEMGKSAAAGVGTGGIGHGQCASIPTGGMLPRGADAAVMVEHSERFGATGIGIYSAVASGENIIHAGDDLQAKARILAAGTRLRAQELGVLAAAGVTEVPVFRAPTLALISTGDELVDPRKTPLPGQVRDVNTTALAAQARACGYHVSGTHVLPDVEATLAATVAKLAQTNDLVVISGGSSQGEKDATARVIDTVASAHAAPAHATPAHAAPAHIAPTIGGVLTHGLAVKPGKPTITGFDETTQTLLIGLPGHPLSAMMVFEVLLAWLLVEATGAPHPLTVPAQLAHNLATAAGKDTLQLVALTQGAPSDGQGHCGHTPSAGHAKEQDGQQDGRQEREQQEQNRPYVHGSHFVATPIHTKSGLITKLVEADGYLWIDRNTEGVRAGDTVAVHRFTL